MKKLTFLLLIAATVATTGCATIIGGSKHSVRFESEPSSATVYDNGIKLGETPLQARLTRGDNHDITIRLDGFKPYNLRLTRQFNEWVIGNIVFGGFIGIAVDAITGGLYKLNPEQVSNFDTTMAHRRSGSNIYISVTLSADPDWQRIGTMEAAD